MQLRRVRPRSREDRHPNAAGGGSPPPARAHHDISWNYQTHNTMRPTHRVREARAATNCVREVARRVQSERCGAWQHARGRGRVGALTARPGDRVYETMRGQHAWLAREQLAWLAREQLAWCPYMAVKLRGAEWAARVACA